MYFLPKLWNPFGTLPLGSGLAVLHFTTRDPAGFIVDTSKEEKPHVVVGAIPKKAAALFRVALVVLRRGPVKERHRKTPGLLRTGASAPFLPLLRTQKKFFVGRMRQTPEF